MKLKNLLAISAVIILSVFIVKPFFQSGLFTIHDNTQVERVFEMSKSLKDGMFPVRWVSDLGYGYGYPIFNFYAPFAYYLGALLVLGGLNIVLATKVVMILGVVLGGIFMYMLASELWGKLGGIISSLFYLYAPYHAVNVYVRGDLAEFWAYSFIPLVFYGLLAAYKKRKWRYSILAAVSFAFLIISHNLSAMMITPVILAFILLLFFLSKKKKEEYLFIFAPLLIGLILSSFYWIPVFLEMKYTNVISQVGGGADFRNHFICPIQLWDSPWGYGGSAPGCVDGLSLKVGKLHLVLVLFSIGSIAFFSKKFKEHKEKIILASFIVMAFFASMVLSLEMSRPLWELAKPMAFFQYPWRFLLGMSFFSSLLIGVLFSSGMPLLKMRKVSIIAVSGLVILLIFAYSKNFVPQFKLKYPVSYYQSYSHLAWNTSLISSEYMPKGFSKPDSILNLPDQNMKFKADKELGRINITELKSGYLKAETNPDNSLISANTNLEKMKVHVNLAYFPGWKLYIDGLQTEFRKTNQGMEFDLEKGRHLIELRFEETTVERLSNYLSLLGLFLIILGIIYSKKKSIL